MRKFLFSMRKDGEYSKAQVEILKLLYERFQENKSVQWTEFLKHYRTESHLYKELNELFEFFIKEEIKSKRHKTKTKKKPKHVYWLNPEKEDEVLGIINTYYIKNVKPHHDSFLPFIKVILIFAIVGLVALSVIFNGEHARELRKPILKAYTLPDIMMGLPKINCTLINISEAGNRTLYRDPGCNFVFLLDEDYINN